jgi:hypothetical protein
VEQTRGGEREQGHDRSRRCIRCNEATSMHCGIFRDWNLGRALRGLLSLSCLPASFVF